MKINAKAKILTVTASIIVGLTPILIKEVTMSGMSAEMVVAYRMLFVCIGATILGKATGQSFRISGMQLITLATFGFIGYGITHLMLSLSYLYIEMSMATMFHFLYPVLVTGVMIIVFREPCYKTKIAAMICGFVGVILLASINGRMAAKGILLAMLSGCAYGAFLIAQERAPFSNLNIFVIVSYVGGVCFLFFTIYSLIKGKSVSLSGLHQLPYLLGAGVCSTVSMAFLNYGVRHLGASSTSFLNIVELGTNLIADMIIYHAFPSRRGWIGFCFMAISIILISMDTKEKSSVPEEKGQMPLLDYEGSISKEQGLD